MKRIILLSIIITGATFAKRQKTADEINLLFLKEQIKTKTHFSA